MTKSLKDYVWPIVGFAAVAFSGWMLYHQLRDISFEDIVDSLYAISFSDWVLAVLATLAAYAALAGYDRLALKHLNKRISWGFIAISSFTAYAIGHNLGASVLSGGVVRYRAYSSKGLTAAEIGVLVAFCSFTFSLAAILLGGMVMLMQPSLIQRFFEDMSLWVPFISGVLMLGFVLLYVLGSRLKFRSLKFRRFALEYPRPAIVAQQLIIGPLELLAAAAIVYFALPDALHISYVVVLGIFLASFSMALLSHAPGGLGVLEVCFLIALPDVDPADVVAALLVFRFLYLLIPLALSLVFVVLFEHAEWLRRRDSR
jgi:uncharacterized membrane protein YbhN (UPF0104 family)